MLQQTQVDRVGPRYTRFLNRFPTIESLANASLRDVLEEWSGLGYNGRGRRLWEAARIISEAGWPGTSEGLRTLPGVGPYTAAAVASFAFGRREAAIDTNLRRVLSRWEGRVLGGTELRRNAAAMVPEESADWNQAIMDLGTAICRTREPRCEICPVEKWCSDPAIAPPVPRQGRFEGSRRQIRGRVLRLLGEVDSASERELARNLPAEPCDLEGALDTLVREGLISVENGRFRLGE